ncbi:MAG TPA: valine--tRNA ligase [Verrucomicrobiae bacterium]|nr:valine--tRNA ligase [Verrucomicrobiae bacterium]
MSEISKAYEPQAVEEKWYQFWLDGKFFVADPKSAKPAYSIVIPPPNVTGVLTMGHVLNNTIQDILARKARMDGKEVLWLPGTDHAGIATQTVVERTLKKSGEIKHRDDLGRDKFLERVWQWKEKHGGIIIQQLKKLGASCDWTRERFTMDENYSRCVQKVFVELYKKGLIYRGKRMVNWCPATLTALSDEEVVMKEQRGSLYYFKVEIAEAPGTFLTIATTRPETIPGDTAVAVNPKDPRYAHLIGKHVIRPLPAELPREQKLIPIIGDEHVDFEFGTGVLKVTPAHDKADFEIGTRHHLPTIEVIDARGQMNDAAGADLRGLDRFKARKVAAEKLSELGALEKEEPYTNNVGYSERADVPIEPRLSEQWFLKYPSADKARNCVELGSAAAPAAPVSAPLTGTSATHGVEVGATSTAPGAGALPKMKFHPERWAKVYDHWMGGLQDWCISRQLWWGHRIPVWRNGPEWTGSKRKQSFDLLWKSKDKGIAVKWPTTKTTVSKPAFNVLDSASEIPNQNVEWTTVSVEVAIEAGNEELVDKLEQLGFVQDPDVLDTWFSSWLWPFATMGWPTPTDTLKKFYPTTDLVTGPDIIFFWVARMIMAGYEFMGEMPFKNVYFTGIIRDKQGRKMSKSLGNSPDPLDLIAKFGADALRFGVMRAAPLGQDILFDEQNVELGRNFCNKLWNACRFRQMQGGGDASSPDRDGGVAATYEVQGEIDPKLLTSDDKWILLKLDAAIRELNTAFAEYKFSDATATLYRFFWNEYCDWYVEASKSVFFGNDAAQKANSLAVIDFVLSHTLRLFHPFIPFVSEELWHGMGFSADMPENQGGKTIMFAPWPKPFDNDFKSHFGLSERDEKFIEARNEFIAQGRNLRRNANIPANKKVKFIFKPAGQTSATDVEVLKLLLNAESVEVNPNFQPSKNVLAVRADLGELFLPLEGLIDVEAEKSRLKKEIEKAESEISKVEAKLSNPNFMQKVPANVLDEHKQRLADWQNKLTHAKSALAALES